MKRLDMNLNQFASSPILISKHSTAHSGPELLPYLSNSREASELVSLLLADSIELVHSNKGSHAAGAHLDTVISLARR
jgi:hypothetical protein